MAVGFAGFHEGDDEKDRAVKKMVRELCRTLTSRSRQQYTASEGRTMNSVFLLGMFLLALELPAQAHQQVQIQAEENVVQDSIVIKKVLKAVRIHVLSVTKDRRRPLVVKDGKKSRRFIVVEFIGTVTRNKSLYTAQLDTDEFDRKIPRILFVDVKVTKGIYKVVRTRIGPNHFRNKDAHE